MIIGDLTLGMIGTARVRTEYEGATIEGLVTGLDLDITVDRVQRSWSGIVQRGPEYDVAVNLRLGNIDLHYLDRSHPCEVVS